MPHRQFTPEPDDSGKALTTVLSYLDDWEQWLDALLASTPPTAESLETVRVAIREHVNGHDCLHPETTLVVLVCSNGTEQYYRQCNRCGQHASSYLPHKSLSEEERTQAQPRTDFFERRWMLSQPVKMQMLQRVGQWWTEQSGTDYQIKANATVDYHSYIDSQEWRNKSATVRAKALHKCQNKPCRNPATEVHHLHYNTLGFERDEDLIAVCHSCHQELQGRCW